MNHRANILIVFACLCVGATGGCQTDPLWEGEQRVEAPITPMDAPEGVDLPEIQIVEAQEVDLVEQVLKHRAMYNRMLRLLRDYYQDRGYERKRQWADAELTALNRVQPFKYLIDAEVPSEDLRPAESIAEADTMYDRAVKLMREGGHGTPALYRHDVMLDALETFVEMIRQHPTSDKIDDAAFFCGEIHKEYLKGQEPIAVEWYERAFTWDPNTPHNARFQAAVTYDFRLHDRARALELYHQVIEVENRDRSNVAFATRRIRQLTTARPDQREVSAVQPGEMFGEPRG